MNNLISKYNKVTIVCLINKKRGEGKLGNEYENNFNKYKNSLDSESQSKMSFNWFDYHSECSHLRYHNIMKLINLISENIKQNNFFSIDVSCNEIMSKQDGIMRVNCMDNLDRTNVTQSVIARYILLMQIQKITGEIFEINKENLLNFVEQSELEIAFRTLWTENGDNISLFYAGTHAMKRDFTKYVLLFSLFSKIELEIVQRKE